jgi:hypothetical protein
MGKKRIGAPGIIAVERGLIKVKNITLDKDYPDIKVWTITVSSRQVESSVIYQEYPSVVFDNTDYYAHSDTTRGERITTVHFDLPDNTFWNLIVQRDKDDHTVIAMRH